MGTLASNVFSFLNLAFPLAVLPILPSIPFLPHPVCPSSLFSLPSSLSYPMCWLSSSRGHGELPWLHGSSRGLGGELLWLHAACSGGVALKYDMSPSVTAVKDFTLLECYFWTCESGTCDVDAADEAKLACYHLWKSTTAPLLTYTWVGSLYIW